MAYRPTFSLTTCGRYVERVLTLGPRAIVRCMRRSIGEVPALGGLAVRAAEDAVLDAGLLPLRVSPGLVDLVLPDAAIGPHVRLVPAPGTPRGRCACR